MDRWLNLLASVYVNIEQGHQLRECFGALVWECDAYCSQDFSDCPDAIYVHFDAGLYLVHLLRDELGRAAHCEEDQKRLLHRLVQLQSVE